MTKENGYLDDERKHWVVSYNDNTFVAEFVSARNSFKQVAPEINFVANDKEFIVQFNNSTDLIAARDSQHIVNVHVLPLKRSKRIPATIVHILKINL